MTKPSPDLALKLANRLDKSGGPSACWPWNGAGNAAGYGQVRHAGKRPMAHVVAYELAFGVVPFGKIVCHRCDNPRCCNPAHLFAGTHRDNTQDMMAKGRDRFWGRPSLSLKISDEDEIWAEACEPAAHDLRSVA